MSISLRSSFTWGPLLSRPSRPPSRPLVPRLRPQYRLLRQHLLAVAMPLGDLGRELEVAASLDRRAPAAHRASPRGRAVPRPRGRNGDRTALGSSRRARAAPAEAQRACAKRTVGYGSRGAPAIPSRTARGALRRCFVSYGADQATEVTRALEQPPRVDTTTASDVAFLDVPDLLLNVASAAQLDRSAGRPDVRRRLLAIGRHRSGARRQSLRVSAPAAKRRASALAQRTRPARGFGGTGNGASLVRAREATFGRQNGTVEAAAPA